MVLEDAGKMYLSKSGKGYMIVVDSVRVSAFKVYLTAFKRDVEDLVNGKKSEVQLKVIVAETNAE